MGDNLNGTVDVFFYYGNLDNDSMPKISMLVKLAYEMHYMLSCYHLVSFMSTATIV